MRCAHQYRELLKRIPFSEEALYRPSYTTFVPLSAEDDIYLSPHNPILLELIARYRTKRGDSKSTHWTDEFVKREVSLKFFRGDNGYLWQLRDKNFFHHYLCTYLYLRNSDRLGMFSKATENGSFGVHAYNAGDGVLISRDLLDSINELYFLEEVIGERALNGAMILDIGAGYGRFATRAAKIFPGISQILCADAVAQSTFLCDHYIKSEGVADRVKTVPWDQLDALLAKKGQILLATNIHSFSECSHADIQEWINLVNMCEIRYLFIVPNAASVRPGFLGTHEPDRQSENYLPSIEAAGYQLLIERPKYSNPALQEAGVSPTQYLLFERKSLAT